MQYSITTFGNKTLMAGQPSGIFQLCVLVIVFFCVSRATYAESSPEAKLPPPALISTPTPPVVVTAPDPNKIHNMAEEFGEVFSGDRLARWQTPICPYIVGVIEQHKEYYIKSIEGYCQISWN